MKVISDTAEYALRACVWLAQSPQEGFTTQQIAVATQSPPDYLAKVLKQLARGGVLEGKRGSGGGFRLAKPVESISVLAVVNAVDPLERIRVCPLGNVAHSKQLCPLHRRVDGAIAQVESAFASSTLAELMETGTDSLPLCPRG